VDNLVLAIFHEFKAIVIMFTVIAAITICFGILPAWLKHVVLFLCQVALFGLILGVFIFGVSIIADGSWFIGGLVALMGGWLLWGLYGKHVENVLGKIKG
jgi:hypothetical protein